MNNGRWYRRNDRGWLALAFRALPLVLCLPHLALSGDDSGVLARSKNVQEFADWIESTERATGKPPTDREFAKKAVESRYLRSELIDCWTLLIEAHDAFVSKQDLIELIQAKRAAIHDVHCKYAFQQERLGKDGEMFVALQEENTFFQSGAKLRIKSRRQLGSDVTLSDTSYDGSFVQYVDLSPSLNTPNASIRKLAGRSDYFRTYDVLANAMLLNSDVDLGIVGARAYDLLELLNAKMVILQELEEVDGRMCLVINDSLFRVYLDVDRNFSVVRVDGERFVTEIVDGVNVATGYQLAHQRKLSAFKDHGAGIWLPHKMETTILEEGSAVIREVTEVVELAVNEGVDDDLFVDIIPEGAFVFDSIREASYRYGDDASIEGTLGSEVDARRRRIRWGLVVVNLVVLCGLAIWHFWRRSSKPAH